MFSKLLKLFLFMFVAFVGVSVLMFTAYSASKQDISDRPDFNRSIPATRPAQSLPKVNGNIRPSNNSPLRSSSTAALPKPTVRPQQSDLEKQIRWMLNNTRIEQIETRQRYGAKHPFVRRLDKKVEMLEAQLKAEVEGEVTSRIQLRLHAARTQQRVLQQEFGNSHPEIVTLDRQIKFLEDRLQAEDISTLSRPALTPEQLELQQKIELAEENASQLANLSMNADVQDEVSQRSPRLKLQEEVQEAFDLRMRLQNAQLDDAEKKLAISRQRLVRRQSLSQQIVQRRVNELLDTDETKWGTQSSGLAKIPTLPSDQNSAGKKPDPLLTYPTPLPKQAAGSRSLTLVDPMHKVGPGDVLGIFVPGVFNEIDSKFSGTGSGYPIYVKSDGRISLPISGRLKVAGKTVLEIENEVKKKYVDGTNPIIREQDRDTISVVVQQVYEPSTRANSDHGLPSLVDPLHQVKAGDVLSIFVPTVFEGRNRGPTSPGYPIYVKSDGQISLPLIGRLKVAGKTALEIEDEVKKKYADGPNPIFEEEYRDSISVSVYQAYKPAVRKRKSVSAFVNLDAAQQFAKDREVPLPSSLNQSEYQRLLGYWEVVFIEGKGGKFMTLDDSTKVGDTLVIANVKAPIGGKKLDRSKIYMKSPFERRWFSDELKKTWAKDDSLSLYLNDDAGPNAEPYRMTYRAKNGSKGHLSDPEDPAEFAIYQLSGDELTIMAGDPNDFKVSQGQEINRDSNGSPVKWKWRLVIPKYAKEVKLDPSKRQLLAKLRRVDPTSPKAASPVANTETIRPLPLPSGNQPPASAPAPYALRFKANSKTPSALLKKGKPDADGVASYKFWAAAEPVAQLQGRWQAKRISAEGKEVALDSAFVKKTQLSQLIVDGKQMIGASPNRQEAYLLAHPDIPDAAILVEVDDQTKTSLLRFSLTGDSLKIAINDTYNQLDPPPLKPNDDVIYIEYERAPEERNELSPLPAKPPSSTASTVSDAASKPTGPQRTKYGLVYRDADQKYPYAVAVSVSGKTTTVVIVDAALNKTPPNSNEAIRADSLKITQNGDGSFAETTFVLPAIDTNKKGHSSVFHLEDPSLVKAVTQGSYTISFKDAGEKYVYPIFQDAQIPLVPRLQLIEAHQWANAQDMTQAVKDDRYRYVLPRSPLWLPKRAGNQGNKQETVLVARRFAESTIDENDILSAIAKPDENFEEKYAVYVELTAEGATRMAQATKRLLKQSESDETLRLAILIDGEVIMAPRVRSAMSSSIAITGDFTKAEAERLAASISN